MKIEIVKFGNILISRPAGREAFAAARAYILPEQKADKIELDFAKVDVLSPSWADEFISALKKAYPDALIGYLNTNNQSVKETLEILQSQPA